jgi:lysophospholipase L1-like esterase
VAAFVRRAAIALAAAAALLGAAEIAARRAVPACGITPFRLSAVPGLASELRPSFRTLYKGHVVEINSSGFRGPEFPGRADGVLRVALAGDSFTFGNGVGFEDTLGAQLERALAAAGRPAQVLNLGVPGYTATNVASVVAHRAPELAPDVVVYVFYANDVDAPASFDSIPPDARIDTYWSFPLRSALLQRTLVAIKQTALAFDVPLGRRTPASSRAEYLGAGGERVRAALATMRDACAACGAQLVVAAYPHLTEPRFNPFRPIDELALADARALGIAAVDLLEAFEGEDDLSGYWVSSFDQHPDGEANARVAARLAGALAGR